MQFDGAPATNERTEVTSVVCFAFADMVAIRSLQGEIPGDHIQLVPGIDRDLEGLVVQLLGDAPAVVVVVHSPQLSAEPLAQVLATFSKQRQRNHRLCVVEFDPQTPLAFLNGVAAAVDKMRGRTAPPPGPSLPSCDPGATRRRTPTPTAQPRPSADQVALALGGFAKAPAEVAKAPAEVAEAPEPATSAAEETLSATSPGPCDSSTFPELGPPISNVRQGQAERAGRRATWRGVAVAAVALGAIGSLAWSQGIPSLQQATAESSRAAGPDLAPRKASLAAEPPPPRVASRAHAVVSPKRVPPMGDPVSDDAAAESRRVAAALDAKQMHALDALLIRAASRKREPFAAARKRCTKLEVAGLAGWRLPSLDELRTLRRARMLPEGEYWSTSRARGTVLFTLSRDRNRPQERPRGDAGNVQALCVRQR